MPTDTGNAVDATGSLRPLYVARRHTANKNGFEIKTLNSCLPFDGRAKEAGLAPFCDDRGAIVVCQHCLAAQLPVLPAPVQGRIPA